MVAVFRAVECVDRRLGLASSQNSQCPRRDRRLFAVAVGRRRLVEHRVAIPTVVAGLGDERAWDADSLSVLATVETPRHGRGRYQDHGRLRLDARSDRVGGVVCGGHLSGSLARDAVSDREQVVESACAFASDSVRNLFDSRSTQRGAYVVEFSLIFLALFLVLYGILMYGMIFTAQQSLNLAAHDGARQALQWQAGANHMQLRAQAALVVAQQQADWIASISGTPLSVAVCGATGPLSAVGGGSCSGRMLADDQLEVVVSYPYAQHPLIPKLMFIGDAMLPASLSARGSVRLSDLGGI